APRVVGWRCAHVVFAWSGPPRGLRSFPTRRSSDLRHRLYRAHLFRHRRVEQCGQPDRRSRWSGDHADGDGWRWPGHLLLLVGERSEEHTSELQSRENLVCRLLLEKKKTARRPHG